MKTYITYIALTILCPLNMSIFSDQGVTTNCDYDLKKMLSLDQQAFDQDLKGGWRPVAANPNCYLAAAELISIWRSRNSPADIEILYWHEGQLYALAGNEEAALPLFKKSFKTVAEDNDWNSKIWNAYVRGTIAFINNDRIDLERAYAELEGYPDPYNLNILRGFKACFDEPYSIAYREPCRR